MRRKFDEPLRKKLSRLEANGKLYVALAEGTEVPYLSMPLLLRSMSSVTLQKTVFLSFATTMISNGIATVSAA